MDTKITYNSINNIRTKLLLFIDKEIRSNKIKNIKLISKTHQGFTPRIQLEETFSQTKQDEIYLSFNQKEQDRIKLCESSKKYIETNYNKISNKIIISKFKNHKNKRNEIFHSNFYPKKDIEQNNSICLEIINEYKNKKDNLNSNEIFNLNGKIYSIKSSKKISSVINISDKSTKGEKYLQKLCDSLKITKPKQIRKRSSVCFYSNFSKSKDKLTRLVSFHLLNQYGKNQKAGISTTKHVDEVNRIKNKIKKIKLLHRKFTKKDNLNNNSNISIASRK